MSPALAASTMDMASTGWLHQAWVPLTLAGLWLLSGLVLMVTRKKRSTAFNVGLIASGVLILGWLTYVLGPGAGVMFFVIAAIPTWFASLARHSTAGGPDAADVISSTADAARMNASVSIARASLRR